MRDSKKLRRFYFFACCPPGLERLLTGEVTRNFVICYWHFLCLAKNLHKWFLIGCVKLGKGTISFVMSVCPSVCTHGRNFMKLGTWIFFKHLPRTFKFRVNLTENGFWHEVLRIFFINSRSTFLVIKKFQRKFWGKIKTHILWQKMFIRKIVSVKR